MAGYYTDEQLAQAGQALASGIRSLQDRLASVEAAPQIADMNQQWQAGRAVARQKGYQGEDLQRLEQLMVDRGIANHMDAMRVAPSAPSRPFWFLNVSDDERKQLLGGDTESFLGTAIQRALAGDE